MTIFVVPGQFEVTVIGLLEDSSLLWAKSIIVNMEKIVFIIFPNCYST